MRILKYKITPALILAFLVTLYTFLHFFSLIFKVIKDNKVEKHKTEQVPKKVSV